MADLEPMFSCNWNLINGLEPPQTLYYEEWVPTPQIGQPAWLHQSLLTGKVIFSDTTDKFCQFTPHLRWFKVKEAWSKSEKNLGRNGSNCRIIKNKTTILLTKSKYAFIIGDCNYNYFRIEQRLLWTVFQLISKKKVIWKSCTRQTTKKDSVKFKVQKTTIRYKTFFKLKLENGCQRCQRQIIGKSPFAFL
jgi:hypothetical protein